MRQCLPNRAGGGVCEDARSLEPLAQLNRDRRRGPNSALGQRVRLLLEHAPELLGLEVGLVPAGCEQAPDRAGDGSDTGAGGGQAPTGVPQIGEERLAASVVRLGHLCERLDRLARHPARTVLTIVTELCDPAL